MRLWPKLRDVMIQLFPRVRFVVVGFFVCMASIFLACLGLLGLARAYIIFTVQEPSCSVYFEFTGPVSRVLIEGCSSSPMDPQVAMYDQVDQEFDEVKILPSSVSVCNSISIKTFHGDSATGQFYLPADHFVADCASAARNGCDVEIKQIANTGLVARIVRC